MIGKIAKKTVLFLILLKNGYIIVSKNTILALVY